MRVPGAAPLALLGGLGPGTQHGVKTTSPTGGHSPGVAAHEELVAERAAHEGAARLYVLEVDHPARRVGLDSARQSLR